MIKIWFCLCQQTERDSMAHLERLAGTKVFQIVLKQAPQQTTPI